MRSIAVVISCLSRLFSLVLVLPLIAADPPVKFEHLTSEDGLSQNSVYSILQDSDGFMWFGTRFGLNRYDGKNFKIFRHNPLDDTSLPGVWPRSLWEDSNGNLWVGTKNGGVGIYDKQTENFIRFRNDPSDPNSLASNFTICIFEDSQGTIWVGTDNGLSKYKPLNRNFETLRNDPNDSTSISDNKILSLAEIPDGTLWIGAEDGSLTKLSLDNLAAETVLKGDRSTSLNLKCLLADTTRGILWAGLFGEALYKIDLGQDSISVIGYEGSRPFGNLHGVQSIAQDKNGVLWLGAFASITSFDPATGNYRVFQNKSNSLTSLSDNMVYVSYIDRQGIIWAGTESGGVNFYDPNLIRFQHFRNDPNNTNSINGNMVFSISKDAVGNIWFGTLGGGTSVRDSQTGTFRHFTTDDNAYTEWSRNYISRILPSKDKTAWIGTFECGLINMQYPSGDFKLYRNTADDPNSFSDKTTRAILETRDGTIWIGTEANGLNRFNRTTQTFTRFMADPADPRSISSNSIYSLLEDHAGFIWIGTADQGLDRFDPRTEIFTHYKVSLSDKSSIAGNNIPALYEDDKNNLWIATRGGGLNKLTPNRKHFTTLDLHSEPSSLNIFGILQDENDYLWLSSNQGVLKAHPDSGIINAYTMSDGLQSDFYFSSCVEADNGLMYFGGIDGYNVFHPDSIKNNAYIPPIVLTELMINYEKVEIGANGNGRIILEQSITYTKELNLSYRHKVIRFKFAALNYSASYKNQFAYKLEGYDKDWIHSGNENTAQYMNLPAGHYTFRVRGTNNDGIWNNNGTSISIIITPPFWKTWWFKVALVLSLLGFTLLYIQLRIAKLKSQQIKLEALVRERTQQLKLEMEERQRVELEKSQEKMDHLKRELLTQTLHLNDKQQTMDNLQKQLEVACEGNGEKSKPRLKKLLRFIKDRTSVKQGWEDFELWFTEVHTGFYSALREAYPELSESELKVCALLRLKMISKDIAHVMNVQPASVDIYRHRIRKKMDLTSEDNLSTFLAKY